MSLPVVQADLLMDRDPRLHVRTHNRLMRALLKQQQGIHWRQRLPGHFETSAVNRYGYRKRDAKYQRFKARRYGTTKPNVKTGVMRQFVLHVNPRITGTKNRSTMFIRIPLMGGATRRFRRAKTIKQLVGQELVRERISEIEAITLDERREIATDLAGRYVKAVNSPSVPKKVRVR